MKKNYPPILRLDIYGIKIHSINFYKGVFTKDQCVNDLVKKPKSSKLKCVHHLVSISFPMFTLIQKYTNVQNYLSCRVGYCVNIEIPLRLSPALTLKTLKKYERSDVTFSYASSNIQNE